jgi:alginate O-acetyltransferase complex protein AlgI
MLFTSLQYLLFLPCVVFLYWVLPRGWRLPLLLIASYYFYASWVPAMLLLVVGLTIFNFVLGRVLAKATGHRKALFVAGVAGNLLCLSFFKYANLILTTLCSVAKVAHAPVPNWHADILLPLGISFFVFEFIHYLFEVYKGNEPMRSFVLFALFAAFFPTQIAGPIKRYKDFQAQMETAQNFRLKHFEEGVPLIIQGMAKKLLVANNLAQLVDMGYSIPREFGAPELWLFAYAFALQIYFDFSGYTDIARGSAMLLGYHIPINFNLPYIAKNMSDFWHRWHISLSTWLRDYLFIPLGGSRHGRWQTNRNLLITMALGGLWHGASWSFVVWGLYHGVALIVHREFGSIKKRFAMLARIIDSPIGNAASILFTFHVVCVGWVFFRIHQIGTAWEVARRMVCMNPIRTAAEAPALLLLKSSLPVIVPITAIMTAVFIVSTFLLGDKQQRWLSAKIPIPLKALYPTTLVVLLILFLPDSQEPFIYFQF